VVGHDLGELRNNKTTKIWELVGLCKFLRRLGWFSL
jgi:hypothetical protein